MGETIQLLTTADVRKLLKIGNKTCLNYFIEKIFLAKNLEELIKLQKKI